MSDSWDTTLRRRGYTVEPVMLEEDEAPTIFMIDGHGVTTYVKEDDSDAIDSLLDKEAHDERREQASNPQRAVELQAEAERVVEEKVAEEDSATTKSSARSK